MAEIDISKELREIKELLRNSEQRAQSGWLYNIGFASMIASLAIVNFEIWGAVSAFATGFILMMIPPKLRG